MFRFKKLLTYVIPVMLAVSTAYAQNSDGNTAETSPAPRQVTTFVIGTGTVSGSNYITGGALCSIVNLHTKNKGYRCLVEPADSVIDNMESLKRGNVSMVIIPSDWQYYATKSLGYFADGYWKSHIRSIFALQSQPIYIVARSDRDIEEISDLKGKRINLGLEGSGNRTLSEAILKLGGLSYNAISEVYELSSEEASDALCADNLDAFIFSGTYPSAIITKAQLACDAKLVPISGNAFEQLRKDNPYFVQVSLPKSAYKSSNVAESEQISTLAFTATLVTTSAASDRPVYVLSQAIIENFERFTSQSPLLQKLDIDTLINAGITARRHKGVDDYLSENNLLQ